MDTQDTEAMRDAEIRQAYAELLGRAPAPQALKMWKSGPLSVAAIRERIRATEEFAVREAAARVRASTGHMRRLLVFGAYGNGNLGDMIQADSLRRAIAAAQPSVDVWATSVMGRPFPFADGRALPPAYVRHPAALSVFDAILIGGGGLLAHPHDPLGDADWVRTLPIPAVLFGIGASDFFAPKAAALVRKAAHVSARDHESLLSLQAIRPDVSFCIDPVMGDATLRAAANCPRKGTLWLLRGPERAIHAPLRACIAPGDVVAGIEPDVDAALMTQFPEMVLVTTLPELMALLSACERIISMRYHGIILGLKAGTPAYALDVAKGAALLDMLGLPGCAGNDPAALLAAPAQDMVRTAALIAWHEKLYALSLKSALATAFACVSTPG